MKMVKSLSDFPNIFTDRSKNLAQVFFFLLQEGRIGAVWLTHSTPAVN
jgi:hypothetical protein